MWNQNQFHGYGLDPNSNQPPATKNPSPNDGENSVNAKSPFAKSEQTNPNLSPGEEAKNSTENNVKTPPSESTTQHQVTSVRHAQTTSTYSMFTASSCLPDVETPFTKESWLPGSEVKLSGSMGQGSWGSGSEVVSEDIGDRRSSGKRPKKRAKRKSKDAVIAIDLKQTSDGD